MAVARQRIHLPKHSLLKAASGLLRGDLWEGDEVEKFEREFAEFAGVPEAVTVPSGRAGLRLIFRILDLEPGSEVICSGFGYPAVPYLARAMGHEVRYADCERETLGMAPDSLRAIISDKTKVVIATHLYGVPCRIQEIAEICDAHGASLIEDCAHCMGASVDGRRMGSIGRFGYFSFETSKPVNTMGGGMVTARERDEGLRLREQARAEAGQNLKWLARRLSKTTFEATVTHPLIFNLGVYPALRIMQGKSADDDRFASGYHQDEISLKGKLGRFTNYQAKLGRAQLSGVLPRVERRVANARRLMDRLKDRIQFQRNERPDVESNYMLVTAMVPRMPELAHRLLRVGVDTKHLYMRDCNRLMDSPNDCPESLRAEREVLHLPAHPELPGEQIDRVADKIAAVVDGMGEVAGSTVRAG